MNRQDADKAILRILEQQQGQSPAVCPDANELAAYMEARLSHGETARFEEHAAECAACREALALSMKLAGEEEKIAAAPIREPRKASYRTSPLRLAFGAALVVIAGVMLFQATRQTRLPQETMQVAGKQTGSDVSGGPEAALRSTDAKMEAPAKPSSAVMRAQMQDEKSSVKPVAAPAISAPSSAQLAFEAGNPPRPMVADKMEETRMKALADLVAETQKAKRAQSDPQELKLAMANRPAEAKGQTGQVVGTGNQLPLAANPVAQVSNQMIAQNVQMAQASNTANVLTQQTAQADRQAAVQAGRVAQAQGAMNQAAAGGRGGAGGQQAATPPMRFSETQKVLVMATPAEPGVITHIDKFLIDPLSPYYKAIPAFKVVYPIIPREVAGFAKRLGNRTFYRMTEYWLDAECASHPGAAPREIAGNSREFAAMLQKEPALAELRLLGLPILIHWNGTNYLVR